MFRRTEFSMWFAAPLFILRESFHKTILILRQFAMIKLRTRQNIQHTRTRPCCSHQYASPLKHSAAREILRGACRRACNILRWYRKEKTKVGKSPTSNQKSPPISQLTPEKDSLVVLFHGGPGSGQTFTAGCVKKRPDTTSLFLTYDRMRCEINTANVPCRRCFAPRNHKSYKTLRRYVLQCGITVARDPSFSKKWTYLLARRGLSDFIRKSSVSG